MQDGDRYYIPTLVAFVTLIIFTVFQTAVQPVLNYQYIMYRSKQRPSNMNRSPPGIDTRSPIDYSVVEGLQLRDYCDQDQNINMLRNDISAIKEDMQFIKETLNANVGCKDILKDLQCRAQGLTQDIGGLRKDVNQLVLRVGFENISLRPH